MSKKKKSGGGGGGGGGHDGGGMMRWLLTYADLITLLVAFFVVMYASSQTDIKKFQAIAGAMQNAFNTNGGGGQSLIWDHPGSSAVEQQNAAGDQLDELTEKKMAKERQAELAVQNKDEKEFRKVQEQVSQYAKEQNISNQINMQVDERGLVISIQDTVFFETGKADLQPEAMTVLDKVAKIIFTVPNQIRIEGHTDNDPIHTAEYPDNWRLSTDRAVRVLSYLLNKHGFKPDRLSAAGYGEYRPVADNNTAEGKARNRRVDIVLLRTSPSEAIEQANQEKTIEDQLSLDQPVIKK